MDNNQPQSPRRRLQSLLAIPDNQRTEADWDEIVELEIQLAPGNREDGPGRDMRTATPQSQQNRRPNKHAGGGMGGNKPSGNAGGGGGGQNAGKPPMRKSRNKPHNKPKPPAPASES
jgi:hypothetical protein